MLYKLENRFQEQTMTPAITLEELFVWNQESSNFWKAHLDANPALMALPCGIGGAATSGESSCAGDSAAPVCLSRPMKKCRMVRWMRFLASTTRP